MYFNKQSQTLISLAVLVLMAGCTSAPQVAAVDLAAPAPVKTRGVDVAARALPTRTTTIAEPARYEHVYIDTASSSATSLQTITLEDAVKSEVLASSELQVKPLSKIDEKALNWIVLDATGYKTPSAIEGVGGAGIEDGHFAEVNFPLNGTDVLNEDHLASLIAKARRVAGVFNVVGYADESGIYQSNVELATERAKVVATLLVDAGISRTRVIDVGAGISHLYPGLDANRRASVTFRIEE